MIPICGNPKRLRSVLRFPEVGISVLGMGNSNKAVTNLRQMVKNKDRTFAWLARETGIPYKRVLAEVKNGTRPLSLDVAIATSHALDATLPDLLDEVTK